MDVAIREKCDAKSENQLKPENDRDDLQERENGLTKHWPMNRSRLTMPDLEHAADFAVRTVEGSFTDWHAGSPDHVRLAGARDAAMATATLRAGSRQRMLGRDLMLCSPTPAKRSSLCGEHTRRHRQEIGERRWPHQCVRQAPQPASEHRYQEK